MGAGDVRCRGLGYQVGGVQGVGLYVGIRVSSRWCSGCGVLGGY